MEAVHFTPPIQLESINSRDEGPEGNVNSLSAFLRDANGKLFSLHVATSANYEATVREEADITDFPEPVFVVPSDSISEDILSGIIDGTPPSILGLYLVPQEIPEESA